MFKEWEGLRWLTRMNNEGILTVVQADKGGAIIVVNLDTLRKKTLEKLENPNLYEKLEEDMTRNLHHELYLKWVEGKEKQLIHPTIARNIMGVSDNDSTKEGKDKTNAKCTSSHFKPGKSYFYPSLKIHKLTRKDLIPGVEPPIRLVTALHEGISKRSDVYIASEYFKDLEKDYCKDLLTDSTDALRWLENCNETETGKQVLRAFTYDFKALYDSLKPDLVKEALRHAMNTTRSMWSSALRDWLVDLVDISLRSSIGCFEDNWYVQKNGVPTGGSLCVQLANITVFYVMNKCIYNDDSLMKPVRTIGRYIDVGAGFFYRTEEKFTKSIGKVNKSLEDYGLFIDEHQWKEVGNYAAFLDIKFCFDTEGKLKTDLHVKETDSRNYVHFGSAHPNHIYSGIVYSQCIRLRRIINSQERLKSRLDELCTAFKAAAYPSKMVDNTSNKVLNSKRNLDIRPKAKIDPLNPEILPIRVVSTYGTDNDITTTVRKYEEDLKKTRSFHGLMKPKKIGCIPVEKSRNDNFFQFIKRPGSNLRSRLVKTKSIALGSKHGQTKSCGKKNCATCKSIDTTTQININGKQIKPAPGTCVTYNIIYMIRCKLCNKPYVGKSTRMLRSRFGEHRRAFYKIISGQSVDTEDDSNCIGLHLNVEHGLSKKEDFNKNVLVCILENTCPSSLDEKEHRFIHALKSLRPTGINSVNPFKISLLH